MHSEAKTPIRRVAITTGGGDAPGLNAVIHAVVHSAARLGWEVYGIRDGYDGLLKPGCYTSPLIKLDCESVAGIVPLGGTILGTTSCSNPLRQLTPRPGGGFEERNCSEAVIAGLRAANLDALIAVGGDSSMAIAHELSKYGLPIIGVPKTIDNDLEATSLTFGFDSAVAFATECIDRLRSTAQAHRRIMVVEVMGRYSGWIALNCGIAAKAEAILIPELPYDINKVAEHLLHRYQGNQKHGIVVVGEGAVPLGGKVVVQDRADPLQSARLGGIGDVVARQLKELVAQDTRSVVLGHLLRGGSPTALDRQLGLSFGVAAIHALSEGRTNVMVALQPPQICYVPLDEAVRKTKRVPTDGYAIRTARALDICFGD